MTLPNPPDITEGQIALDPINGIVYYKKNGELIATTWSWLQNDLNEISTDDTVLIDSDLTVSGNLVIEGNTVSLNVAELLIEDNILVLNANFTGSPILNAGIEVERGDEPNTSIRWNEDTNAWQFSNDGINYLELNSIIENSVTLGFHTVGDYVKSLNAGVGVSVTQGSGEGSTPTISIGQSVSVSATPTFARVIAPLTGDVTGNLTGNVTGQVSDLSNHEINDLSNVNAAPSSGNFLKWNGSQWIESNIELGTNTDGNYVKTIASGTGVSIDNGNAEGSTPTISIGQSVGTTDNVIFNQVTANLIGEVLGDVVGQVSDISNHEITDLSDVIIVEPFNGDFLRYDGLSEKWINDPVDLSTDTVGNYVARLEEGLGITITNGSGSSATPTISLDAIFTDLNDVQITSPSNGESLMYDGTNWVNTVQPSSEPIGHENKADSTVSFNESSRQFSIAPVSSSYTVWCKGKRYVKTSTETIEIPDTSGLYYIYFNASGVLSYRTTFFVWDEDTPTAYVYWNADDNKAYFFADERHGIVLDWATHEYLHRTRGAAIANGFGANNYVLDGDGSSNTHAQIDIANGTFFDEDLQVDIFHSATPSSNTWEQVLQGAAEIPVFYRSNTHWVKDDATEFPLKAVASVPQYNLDTAGVWSSASLTNNEFGISWIIATNNLNDPIIALMGQSTYGSKELAEAGFYSELDLTAFPVVEFRPLYKIVYQYKNVYTNSVKSSIVGVYDLRSIIAGGGVPTTAVSDHGSLTGLADDDHPQYLLADGTRTANSITVSGAITTNSLILDGIEIDAATPSDTNVLKYSSALNKYIPGVASTVASLDDLTDVVVSSATPDQILVYQENGTWINSFVPIPSVEGTAFFQTLGDGVTESFTINHNLGTRDVFVSTRDASSPYASFITGWEALDSNNITLTFDGPPSSSSVRVSVYAALAGSSFPDLEGTTYVALIGDGLALTIPVIHSLGTDNVFVQVRNAVSPYEVLNVAWEATSANITTFYFDSAPAEDSIKVFIYSSVIGVPTTSLSGLTDVNYVNPDDNDILAWDETTSRWIPQPFTASVVDINDISNVTITSATPNQYLKYDGLAWINDEINLGSDTTGDYVKNLVAGTGISITNNSGEGATPTIGITNLVVTTSDTGTVTSSMIANGTIVNADISTTAAIAYSKLNLTNSVDFIDLKDGPAKAGFRSSLNAQTGTSYTLLLDDLAKLVTLDNTSPITLTVPLASSVNFAIGDRIDLLQKNTGQVTIAGAVGVTVNATPGLKLRSRWSSATLVKLDTNSWVVIGDMQA